VLGVSKNAKQQEIKQAFYDLSKKYHPDVVGSDSQRFIEIKEAYDVLRDDEKRRAYDIGFNPVEFGNQRGFQQQPEEFHHRGRTQEEVMDVCSPYQLKAIFNTFRSGVNLSRTIRSSKRN
jgi:DnaJ-class molecular chaperone